MDGRFYRTASGESIPDVTVCFDLRTEDLWVCAKYCVVLQRLRAKDDKFFCMRHDSGFRIPVQSKIGWGREGKPTETNGADCFQQSGNERGRAKDVVPIGDDTKPSGAPREKSYWETMKMNVLPVSKVDKVVDHIELLEEEEREGTFLSLVKTGATCCERKGATVYSISFLVGFMCFSQILVRQRTVIQT